MGICVYLMCMGMRVGVYFDMSRCRCGYLCVLDMYRCGCVP